jgi:hypothetical protein
MSGAGGTSDRAAPIVGGIVGGGDISCTASVCETANGDGAIIFSSVVDGIISGCRGVPVGRGNDSASAMLRPSGEPVSIGFIDCSITGVVAAAERGGSAWCQALFDGCSRLADTGVTGSPVDRFGLAGGVVTRVVAGVGFIGAVGSTTPVVVGLTAVGVLGGIGVEAMTAGCETMGGCVGVVGICDIGCIEGTGCVEDIGCVDDIGAVGMDEMLVTGEAAGGVTFMSRDGFTWG